MDLVDVGADMALLAVATFVALLFEDVEHQQQAHTVVTAMFILIFLTLWIICLRITSIRNPVIIGRLWFFDFRHVLSWMFGTLALVLSGVIANVVVHRG